MDDDDFRDMLLMVALVAGNDDLVDVVLLNELMQEESLLERAAKSGATMDDLEDWFDGTGRWDRKPVPHERRWWNQKGAQTAVCDVSRLVPLQQDYLPEAGAGALRHHVPVSPRSRDRAAAQDRPVRTRRGVPLPGTRRARSAADCRALRSLRRVRGGLDLAGREAGGRAPPIAAGEVAGALEATRHFFCAGDGEGPQAPDQFQRIHRTRSNGRGRREWERVRCSLCHPGGGIYRLQRRGFVFFCSQWFTTGVKGKGKGTRDTAGRGTRGYLDEELAERNNRHLAALSGEQGTAKRKQRPWHPNDMFTAYDAKRSQERNKLLDMLVEKALRGRQVKRRRDLEMEHQDLELERQEIALRKAEIWSKQRPRRDTTNHLFALHRAGRLDESQLKAAILADLSPELRKVIEACEQDEGRAGGGAGSPT